MSDESAKQQRPIVTAIVLAAVLLLGFYYYSESRRYSVREVGSRIYRLDHRTGQLWLIANQHLIPIKEKGFTREEEVIDLVKRSEFCLDGTDPTGLSVSRAIKLAMSEKPIVDGINGWAAEKLDDQNYLVTYGFWVGNKQFHYYFRTNLVGQFCYHLTRGKPDLLDLGASSAVYNHAMRWRKQAASSSSEESETIEDEKEDQHNR